MCVLIQTTVSLLQVKYAKSLIGAASHPATFVRVYDICGATYPGEYDAKTRTYTLHYPGLTFLFPIPAQHAEACSENHIGMPLEFSDGSTPLAGRICIYTASEGDHHHCTLKFRGELPHPPPESIAPGQIKTRSASEGLHYHSKACCE